MTVRRVLAVAALVAALPALPGNAAGLPDRVVTGTYDRAAGLTTGTDVTSLGGSPAVTATSRSDEDRVRVSATDTGVVGLVIDVTRPASSTTTRTIVCHQTTLRLLAGSRVTVTPVAGRCTDGTVAAPLGGQVQLSFHRLPPPPPRNRAAGVSPTERWAVVIGIRDYAGSTHSTVGGAGDAVAVRAALMKAGWRDDHILMVLDGDATATGIRQAWQWLADRSAAHTFSLLHYSGHVCIASRGPCGSGHTYLWSYDNRFLPETEVQTAMRRVRGYSWLDVAGCEAGAFDLHSSTRLFTASSRASETSYENPDWKESYWSGLVWDRGFAGGLADAKGRQYHASIGEMTSYGQRQAPPMTASGEKGSQHPVVAGGSATWSLSAPPGR